MAERSLGLGKIAQPVRVAVTGGTASPGIFEVLEVVGRERSLSRLRHAAATIGGSPPLVDWVGPFQYSIQIVGRVGRGVEESSNW